MTGTGPAQRPESAGRLGQRGTDGSLPSRLSGPSRPYAASDAYGAPARAGTSRVRHRRRRQPARVPPEFGEAVGAATRRLLALDHERGAEAAVPLAAGALHGVREQWRRLAPQRPLPGGDTGAALAELAEVAGWILFDAERQRQAYRLNRQALALAARTGDRWTQRLVLSHLSMQAAHLGLPRASFRIAQSVLDSGPLPARVEALFTIRQSRALALAGRRHEAVAAIRRARGLFADGVSARDPHWAWWMDEHELNGHRGITHARLGDRDTAAVLLRAAVDGPQDQPPAYRALFRTELLSVLVGAGAWREAEEVAARLVPDAGELGSMRAVRMIDAAVGRLLWLPRVPPSLQDTAHCLGAALPDRPWRYGPRPGGGPNRRT